MFAVFAAVAKQSQITQNSLELKWHKKTTTCYGSRYSVAPQFEGQLAMFSDPVDRFTKSVRILGRIGRAPDNAVHSIER
ncbi:M20 family metallopeptidase [Pantoea sp. S62]|nr:M20 family metallopeptidase [Pantoea sp. S62]